MIDLLQNSAFVVLLSFAAFLASYFIYARYLSQKIFELDPTETCPAHEIQDEVDFVPADRHVLFGHHFCSITGAAPIVGPAVAVLWGWVPAVIWVVLGTIFIGAAHDFGTLVLSVRNEGRSISDICGGIIGPWSRTLFLGLVWVLVWLVIAVFAVVIGILFVQFPASVIPVNFEIVAAILIGLTIYHFTDDLLVPSLVVLVALYGVIVLTVYSKPVGEWIPFVDLAWMANFDIAWLVWFDLEQATWMEALGFETGFMKRVFLWVSFLFLYSFIASVIPVWILLQPRDYINSHQVFVGLGALYVGLLIASPQIPAPEYNANVGYPGALASIEFSGDEVAVSDHVPEGLVLIPENAGNQTGEVYRAEGVEDIPQPRFYTVSEILMTEKDLANDHPVRSTDAGQGENVKGTLVPVLHPDGRPWVFDEETKELALFEQPSGARSSGQQSGSWASLRMTLEAAAASAPPLIPFLFITIACGAISGFHGLVSSGTTSKQLSNMEDCRYIGYGGMLGEGMLGLMSVLAATAGFALLAKEDGGNALAMWNEHYASWGGANDFGQKISAFVQGGGAFLGALFDAVFGSRMKELANAIVAIIVVSFAATTLDSATRIQRYIFTELIRPLDVDVLENRYVAGGISAFTPMLLVFGGAWGVLWPLFGATNQMLAGLSMLVITVYLYRKRKKMRNYLVPMVFLVCVTGLGLFLLFYDFLQKGFLQEGGTFQYQLLSVLSIGLFAVSLWIIGQGTYILSSDRGDTEQT
jgi:carbon starvation protein CstA